MIKDKRILYINHYAGSPELGMEFRPFFLSKKWVEQGNQVVLVASSFSHLRVKNPKLLGFFKNEEHTGIAYCWLWGNSYKGNGIGRLVNVFLFLIELLLMSPKWIRFRPDVVIASSTYPLDVPVAYLLAKLSGAKLVHEVHDLWPLTLIELYKIPPKNPFIRLLAWAEDFSIRKSFKIVSMLPGSRRYFTEKGLREESFVLVPNGYQAHVQKDLPDSYVQRMSGIAGIKVAYAGYLGTANAVKDLIEVATKLKSKSVSFCLLGDGPEKQDLQRIVAERSLSNVHFFDRVSKEQVFHFLSLSDIAYIGWNRSKLYEHGISPNKLMDYMAAGLPIIHATNSADDLVAMASAGEVVQAENIEQIARGIEKLAALSNEERRILGENGRRYVQKNLDFAYLGEKFLNSVFN